MAVRLRNYWGEESEESLLPLTIGAPEAGEARETADSDAPEVLDLSGLDIQDALIWDEGIEETQAWDEGQAAAEQTSETSRRPVPQAASYWDMNPDEYDLTTRRPSGI